MAAELVIDAFRLILTLLLPLLAFVAGAAALGALLQSVFHIEDLAISFCARLLGAALGLYLLGGSLASTVQEFTGELWTNAELFY